MLNERKLTKSELDKREDIIKDMKNNKRQLVKRYGKDAEAVMYGRATKLAKQKSESMNPDKIREMIKSSLKNPSKADLNKDGKLSSYEEKRGAAIEKSIEETDVNDSILMKMRADAAAKSKKPDLGKEYGEAVQKAYNSSNLAKLNFLRKERSQLMRDMEQEAEPEGGPIADEYGAKLNRIDKAIAKLSGRKEMTYDQAIAEGLSPKDFPVNFTYGGTTYVFDRIAKDRAVYYNPTMDGDTASFGSREEMDSFLDDHSYQFQIPRYESIAEGDVNESLNPEVSKTLNRFIKAMAKRYDYTEQDAVYAIMAALKQRDFDGLNEDIDLGHQDNEPGMVKAQLYHIGSHAMELYKMMDGLEGMGEVDLPSWWQSKISTAETMIAGAKHYLEFELNEPAVDAMVGIEEDRKAVEYIRSIEDEEEREEERKRMFDDEKESLKEYTSNSFKGSEIIAGMPSPDIFAKKAIEDLFPNGVASEGDAIEALKAHDASPTKARMGRFAPMFVHVQYHDFESGGEEYRAHQTQYSNSNFKDTDPTFNPRVTKLSVDKMVDGKGEEIGTILVKTDEYVKDLKNLNIINKAM